MDNVSNAKITKILSNYHMRFDRQAPDNSDELAIVKCERGWVFGNCHRTAIKRECLNDCGYIIRLLIAEVKPCHCPECMSSDDWVHELPYLRSHIKEICAKVGVVNYEWNDRDHYVAGYFVSDVYAESKPVFIQWKNKDAAHGCVEALVAMNNWDEQANCEREPIKKRVVVSPSTNSLYSALMAIRGDMSTPIEYTAEQMNSEAAERLAGVCASDFANQYIHRLNFERPHTAEFAMKEHSNAVMNKRDERVIRDNGIWWAQLYEPDDVIRYLRSEQMKRQQAMNMTAGHRSYGRGET